MNKKIFSLFLLAFVICFFWSYTCNAQGDPFGGPTDPGGDIPIPGSAYFLFVALAIGAKKIYDARRNFSNKDEQSE